MQLIITDVFNLHVKNALYDGTYEIFVILRIHLKNFGELHCYEIVLQVLLRLAW